MKHQGQVFPDTDHTFPKRLFYGAFASAESVKAPPQNHGSPTMGADNIDKSRIPQLGHDLAVSLLAQRNASYRSAS
jgi:hypothetical protein